MDTGFVDKVCRDVEAHSPKKSHGVTFLQNTEQMVAFSTDILDANGFKIKKEALDYAKDVMPKCRLESIPHKYHHICNAPAERGISRACGVAHWRGECDGQRHFPALLP